MTLPVYECKPQIYIEGSNIQPDLGLSEGALFSFDLTEDRAFRALNTLNYTPTPIGFVAAPMVLSCNLTHGITNQDSLFDFSSLPYQNTNIQLQLCNFAGQVLVIVGGLQFVGSHLHYYAPGIPFERVIYFKAATINTVPQL